MILCIPWEQTTVIMEMDVTLEAIKGCCVETSLLSKAGASQVLHLYLGDAIEERAQTKRNPSKMSIQPLD